MGKYVSTIIFPRSRTHRRTGKTWAIYQACWRLQTVLAREDRSCQSDQILSPDIGLKTGIRPHCWGAYLDPQGPASDLNVVQAALQSFPSIVPHLLRWHPPAGLPRLRHRPQGTAHLQEKASPKANQTSLPGIPRAAARRSGAIDSSLRSWASSA